MEDDMAARPQLDQAIREYLTGLPGEGLERTTIRAYGATLNHLLVFVGNILPENITHSHIQGFFAMRGSKVIADTLLNERVRVNKFLTWCEYMHYRKAGSNPVAHIRKPKVIRHKNEELLRIQVQKFPVLLDIAGERHPRDRAIVAIGLWTLMRESAMKRLRVKDVDLQEERIKFYEPKIKTFANRRIPPDLMMELRRWLTFYTEQQGTLQPEWYLLPSVKKPPQWYLHRGIMETVPQDENLKPFIVPTLPCGEPAQHIRKMLVACGYKIIDPITGKSIAREGCHTLRRSGARAYYESFKARGVRDPLRMLQMMLFHDSRETTEGYIGRTPDMEALDDQLTQMSFPQLHDDNVIPLRKAKEA